MWEGQEISNRPPAGYEGPLFRLSQAFPKGLPEESGFEGWKKFDPFDPGLTQKSKTEQARGYIEALMDYIQEGNATHGASGGDIALDWQLCDNAVRPWFHMPFQTYEPLTGREYMHGLTREAPLQLKLSSGETIPCVVWAVGFYNARGAHHIGKVWQSTGEPLFPKENWRFPEGTVVGKPLFITSSPENFEKLRQLDFLKNSPVWDLNMSDGTQLCGHGKDPLPKQSRDCPRRPGKALLLQFDVAVADGRAPTGWVFGTFVADSTYKAAEKNPWDRISPLGLMWGNDTPPAGEPAWNHPANPRENGFETAVIFWEVVDRLNEQCDAGHLGCNDRLNGPADNAFSSCMSCHGTASVPDVNRVTPPLLAQFDERQLFKECEPGSSAEPATDAVYFADTVCATSFQTGDIAPKPDYASGAKDWISLDYSLQLSVSLVQWQEWTQHRDPSAADKPRTLTGSPPRRR